MRLYVYALVESGIRNPGEGAFGERLRSFGKSPSAIAGLVAVKPVVDERALRAHDAVVRRLAASNTAILPVRFGTTFADEQALVEALRERTRPLTAALARVRGSEQMTLRVFSPVAFASRRSTAVAGDGPGTRFLAGRRAAASAPPALDPILAAVAPRIRDTLVEISEAPPLRVTVHHLIERGSSPEYLRALETAKPGKGLRVHVSGPSPAWAFAATEPIA